MRGDVQVGEREAVHAAADLDRVPQRDGVEMTGPERALPAFRLLCAVGQLERRVLGDQRPGPCLVR